jgi:pimeloyl-ACP methyl ester carboxylesterase
MITGADLASADTGADASKADSSASSSDKADRSGPRRPSRESSEPGDKTATTRDDDTDETEDDDTEADDSAGEDTADEDTADEDTADEDAADEDTDTEPDGNTQSEADDVVEEETAAEVIVDDVPSVGESDEEPAEIESVEPEPAVAPAGRYGTAPELRAARVALARTESTTLAAAPQRTLPDLVQSFIFDFVGAAVTFIAGPPVVPPGSTVTVRTSSLEIAEDRNVPAHWYYPEGDEPPQRIILLQHGFLGVGAMYSYTAANLAERTNSIVVVPTLTSNRYVQDGFWLGDDQALRATAALFLGDRDALTASAIAAGYAQRYGAGVALPGRFALVGHSLGGNLVAGAAGYYADAVIAGGEVNQLAGVVLLDAAPQQNVLPEALDKLDGLGTYIPVMELGAPKESRRVDAALNEHRPGKFNGVVLENGRHLDAMQGGTWLIQLISHLYQGFPTAQNQAAAQTLIDGWVADILDGRIDPSTGKCDGDECAGIYGNPGQILALETPVGPTSGTVIGVPLPARSAEFDPWSATAVVAPRPPVVSGPLLRL